MRHYLKEPVNYVNDRTRRTIEFLTSASDGAVPQEAGSSTAALACSGYV